MPKYKFAVTLWVLSLLTLVLHGPVSAQSEEPRLELGVQISGLAGDRFGSKDAGGGGGWVTYNLTKYIALEGALNYLSSNSSDNFRRFQGQFGVKSGLRFKRFGVFGKIRPGFISTKQDNTPPLLGLIIPIVPNFLNSTANSYTGFSLDVGGVAELYPSKRIVLRFDVGDTIVNRQESGAVFFTPISGGQLPPIFVPGGLPVPRRSFATHNLQLSLGVGFRF
jgi:hypothetical protein